MVVAGFKGTHRCAENFRHVFVFHFVVVAHVEHKALFFGQAVFTGAAAELEVPVVFAEFPPVTEETAVETAGTSSF